MSAALIDAPSALHENGWRRDAVWDDDYGMAPDCLAAWTAFYSKPGTEWQASVTYYVEAVETSNLPEVRDAFGIECAVQLWREVDDEQRDHETDYDYGSVLYYDTVEVASSEAKRLALMDESYIFCV